MSKSNRLNMQPCINHAQELFYIWKHIEYLMIIIVFGLPGSGKSYFASRLAAILKAQYISTDEIRMNLFPERTYSDIEKKKVYDTMLSIMTTSLQKGIKIVLDGTFYKSSLRETFEKRATELHEKIIYIEVTAPEKSIEERLQKPRKSSEANFDIYRKIKETAEPLHADHLVLVSTNDNIASMLLEARHYIDTFK